jgi:hypothetical protein
VVTAMMAVSVPDEPEHEYPATDDLVAEMVETAARDDCQCVECRSRS